MSQQIILNNTSFELIHHTNKKIKRVSIELKNKNEIIVKTPLKFQSHLIKQVVYDYQEWILRSLQKVPHKNQFDFVTGSKVPFLGVQYPMKLVQSDIANVKFEFIDDCFIVRHSSLHNYDNFVAGLKKFYSFQAKKVIQPLFDKWCDITQLTPSNISYRFAKTRWGSCSVENRISINYMLLQFELKAIEYVVLHELCHIVHKNHSKKFWDLVYSYMPDFKQAQQLLRSKLF
ncbi:MAG: M48 family metallopeptidase [Campylobacterales bacterium]|nr:M48 family metallopeptidase [Campylobacterales bacterium]